MKVGERLYLQLLLLYSFLFTGFVAEAVPYDYSATVECLPTPHKPQYGGGIVVNPELNEGLKGWSTFGHAKIEHRVSREGNKFIVAHTRNLSHSSFSQKFFLQKDKLYTFSAWIQVSEGNAPVSAVFKTTGGFRHAGAIVAESGCWSMLKGGLTVADSSPAELYFQSENTSVEIWVDSISLQPFTQKEWLSHQDQSIEKMRKGKVRIHAVDTQGKPLVGANITIKQNGLNFPFGCAMTKHIIDNTAYQNWFASRFKFTTFENEMKWAFTESVEGKEDYSVPDAMLQFTRKNGISVRGHNIFWDDPHYQPSWLNSLNPNQLASATNRRMQSIMKRYMGQVIAWDVENENVHFSYFESKLGNGASASFYKSAQQLDSKNPTFMNEYNTIEEPKDGQVTPAKYIAKMREITKVADPRRMAIGLEGHFSTPNFPYIRSTIDTLAALNIPIWITELDVSSSPNQASYLDQLLRELHAHPAIKGIVMWAAWKPEGCYKMCLTDNNFKNLPTGDVVDKLLHELGHKGFVGKTDADGFFEASLFNGDYEVVINHPAALNSSLAHRFKVESEEVLHNTIVHVQDSA